MCDTEDTTRHLLIPSLQTIDDVAQQFATAIGDRRIIAFYGAMGAGKTTFIRALCQAWGVGDVVTSPTFAIINEYTSPTDVIYHCDCYRLANAQEFVDCGGEEYLYDEGCRCLIEWPERIESLLPRSTVRVHIDTLDDGTRQLSFSITAGSNKEI